MEPDAYWGAAKKLAVVCSREQEREANEDPELVATPFAFARYGYDVHIEQVVLTYCVASSICFGKQSKTDVVERQYLHELETPNRRRAPRHAIFRKFRSWTMYVVRRGLKQSDSNRQL